MDVKLDDDALLQFTIDLYDRCFAQAQAAGLTTWQFLDVLLHVNANALALFAVAEAHRCETDVAEELDTVRRQFDQALTECLTRSLPKIRRQMMRVT